MKNNKENKTSKLEKISKFLTPSNRFWLTLTHVLMVLSAIVMLVQFIAAALYEEDWEPFWLMLAVFVGVLIICSFIQLLVKIEENTRK